MGGRSERQRAGSTGDGLPLGRDRGESDRRADRPAKRLLFMDHLARAIERARRNPTHHFAVLLVDLGRSEPHEDEDGVKAPDPVLTAAARRLETCCGPATAEPA